MQRPDPVFHSAKRGKDVEAAQRSVARADAPELGRRREKRLRAARPEGFEQGCIGAREARADEMQTHGRESIPEEAQRRLNFASRCAEADRAGHGPALSPWAILAACAYLEFVRFASACACGSRSRSRPSQR